MVTLLEAAAMEKCTPAVPGGEDGATLAQQAIGRPLP